MNRCLEIESSFEQLFKVEAFCKCIFKELAFSRKLYCKLYLATIEGVNNAILHGNKEDRNKKVIVKFHGNNEKYIICIQDQGIGFDYTKIPDPTTNKNIREESGRGIFIMKQYADVVTFKDDGRKVKLEFNKE